MTNLPVPVTISFRPARPAAVLLGIGLVALGVLKFLPQPRGAANAGSSAVLMASAAVEVAIGIGILSSRQAARWTLAAMCLATAFLLVSIAESYLLPGRGCGCLGQYLDSSLAARLFVAGAILFLSWVATPTKEADSRA